MNNLVRLFIVLLSSHTCSLIAQYDSNCGGYFPCTQGAQIQWMTFRVQNNQPTSEVELINIISINNHVIQYNRTLSVTNLSPPGTSQFSQQGEIICNDFQCMMGPDFFLPRPAPTLSSFFDPPTITYSGPNCILPNDLRLGPLPDCVAMNIVVESNTSSASSNSFLDGGSRFEFQVGYTQRKVLSESVILEMNNQQIQCAVIQERRKTDGVTNETLYEVSWVAKGVGKIRSIFFREDPGGNWNTSSGSIGSRQAIIY